MTQCLILRLNLGNDVFSAPYSTTIWKQLERGDDIEFGVSGTELHKRSTKLRHPLWLKWNFEVCAFRPPRQSGNIIWTGEGVPHNLGLATQNFEMLLISQIHMDGAGVWQHETLKTTWWNISVWPFTTSRIIPFKQNDCRYLGCDWFSNTITWGSARFV